MIRDDHRARPSTEMTMNPPTSRPLIITGNEDGSSPLSFRGIVQKSILLNVVIVLTSFPVLVASGGPKAVVPTLALMAGITFLIWTATFTLFSFVTLVRISWTAFSAGTRRKPLARAKAAGVADRWMDGPG
jgi:hypothetical protein